MTFNEECRFLDKTRMKTDKIKHKTMEGDQPLFRRKHPCLSEGNELDWTLKVENKELIIVVKPIK